MAVKSKAKPKADIVLTKDTVIDPNGFRVQVLGMPGEILAAGPSHADISGLKVFSATMARDREVLGEKVTEWVRAQGSSIRVIDYIVTQSSDEEYHCVTITVFFQHL